MLEGKVALITGASRGIGAAIADAYASRGAVVYANVREQEACEKLNAKNNPQIRPLRFDVVDFEASKAAVMQIYKEQKRLDILVNNAGIMVDALLGMITNELMKKVFEVNVFGSINLAQLAARIMQKSGSGSIINILSIVGTKGNAGQCVYSASKGALLSFTLSASKELAPRGIRVNAIAPGVISTDLLSNVDPKYIEEKLQRVSMGRVGLPEDIADSAVFLASDMSRYITGQIIGVDGGQIA